MIRFHLALPALAAASLCSAFPQEPAPPAEDPPQQVEEQDENPAERFKRAARGHTQGIAPVRRADGSPILPGEIPEGTSVEARALWKGLVASLEQAKPMQSFRLGFYLRQQDPDPKIRKVNDLDLEFSYLAPRYVRAQLESGRTHLRGPKGDFLIDKQEVIELFGRDAEQDLDQLDRMGAIASNFVALTQPVATLRLVRMALTQAPAELSPELRKEAQGLVWLSVTSPDFFLQLRPEATEDGSAPLYRAQLGIDPESRAVRVAVIHEQRGEVFVQDSAMCVDMSGHRQRAGLAVPRTVRVFQIDPGTRPARFYETPTSTLTLKDGGRLRARLKPEDFLPPIGARQE